MDASRGVVANSAHGQVPERKDHNGKKDHPRKTAEQGGGKDRRQGAAYRQGHTNTNPVHGRPDRIGARCLKAHKEALITSPSPTGRA